MNSAPPTRGRLQATASMQMSTKLGARCAAKPASRQASGPSMPKTSSANSEMKPIPRMATPRAPRIRVLFIKALSGGAVRAP